MPDSNTIKGDDLTTIPKKPTPTLSDVHFPSETFIYSEAKTESPTQLTQQSLPTQTPTTETPTTETPTQIPSPNPDNSTNSTSANLDVEKPYLSTSNATLLFTIGPAVVLIIGLIIGLIIYKRMKKEPQKGTVLQFEPMHPHVVVVDADGNFLGKRNSMISSSNNSFLGGSRGPSRMIKVIAYDNAEEPEIVVGSDSDRTNHQKTMYYEDSYR